MLPGLTPIAPPSIARSITSFSVFGTPTTSTTSSCTAPAGIQAGDIILFANRNDGGGSSTAVPAGFTSMQSSNNGTDGQTLSFKVAAGTEGGTSITGYSGTGATRTMIIVFRPNVGAHAATVGGAVGTFVSTDPVAQVAAASGGTAPLIVVVAYGAKVAISGDTCSPAADGSLAHPSDRLKVAWKLYPAGPADVTADMGDLGSSNCVQGGYLQVA